MKKYRNINVNPLPNICSFFGIQSKERQKAKRNVKEKEHCTVAWEFFLEADSGQLQNQWKLVPRVETDLCWKSLLAPHQASTYFVSRTFTNDQ